MFESQLRRIAAQQGVFLRREALALGYDDRDLRNACKAKRWVRVHHGCYTFADAWAEADDVARHRIQSRAILRTHNGETVLSHASSVAEREVDIWGVDLSRTHITKPRDSCGELGDRIQPHSGALLDNEFEVLNGVRATVLPRAIVEAATWETTESGLVMADSAQRKKLVALPELEAAYDSRADWPGGRRASLVLRLTDGRAESVGETRSRYLMWQQGIPLPDLQHEVYDNGVLIGRTDFAWPEHRLLGEFDGKVKYGRLVKEGETPSDVVMREKRREEQLYELTGWRMIRLSWADLYDPVRTAARLRRMLRLAA